MEKNIKEGYINISKEIIPLYLKDSVLYNQFDDCGEIYIPQKFYPGELIFNNSHTKKSYDEHISYFLMLDYWGVNIDNFINSITFHQDLLDCVLFFVDKNLEPRNLILGIYEKLLPFLKNKIEFLTFLKTFSNNIKKKNFLFEDTYDNIRELLINNIQVINFLYNDHNDYLSSLIDECKIISYSLYLMEIHINYIKYVDTDLGYSSLFTLDIDYLRFSKLDFIFNSINIPLLEISFSYYGLEKNEVNEYNPHIRYNPIVNYLKNNLLSIRNKRQTFLQNIFHILFISFNFPENFPSDKESVVFMRKFFLIYENSSIHKLFSLKYKEFINFIFDKNYSNKIPSLLGINYIPFYQMINILYIISFDKKNHFECDVKYLEEYGIAFDNLSDLSGYLKTVFDNIKKISQEEKYDFYINAIKNELYNIKIRRSIS